MTIHLSSVFSRAASALARGVIASALAHGVLCAQSSRGNAPVPPRGLEAERNDFFGDPSLRVFQIELSEAAMESLRRSSNTYVRGTVREGVQVFTTPREPLPTGGNHQSARGSAGPVARRPGVRG